MYEKPAVIFLIAAEKLFLKYKVKCLHFKELALHYGLIYYFIIC